MLTTVLPLHRVTKARLMLVPSNQLLDVRRTYPSAPIDCDDGPVDADNGVLVHGA